MGYLAIISYHCVSLFPAMLSVYRHICCLQYEVENPLLEFNGLEQQAELITVCYATNGIDIQRCATIAVAQHSW